jgi:hypothetical protein
MISFGLKRQYLNKKRQFSPTVRGAVDIASAAGTEDAGSNAARV